MRMTVESLVNKLFPGFFLLSEEQKEIFLQKAFIKNFIEGVEEAIKLADEESSWVDRVKSLFVERYSPQVKEQLDERVNNLIEACRADKAYSELWQNIKPLVLVIIISQFNKLSFEEQKLFLGSESVDELLAEQKPLLIKLGYTDPHDYQQSELVIELWKKVDKTTWNWRSKIENTEPKLTSILNRLDAPYRKKAQEVTKWILQLPILQILKNSKQSSSIEDKISGLLFEKLYEDKDLNKSFEEVIDENISLLMGKIACCLQESILDSFVTSLSLGIATAKLNSQFSLELALAFLSKLLGDQSDLSKLLDNYKIQLEKELKQKAFDFSEFDKAITQNKSSGIGERLSGLVSSILGSKNEKIKGLTEKSDELADAFTFFQATGAVQMENPVVALLNLYNVQRYSGNVKEIKGILSSVGLILAPLRQEMRDISRMRNPFAIFLKVIMPFAIAIGTAALVSIALNPLGLSGLAMSMVVILSLLPGFGLSSLYILGKNKVHAFLRNHYYGGYFETPEFQLNERMIKAFNNDLATKVREFYISEIKSFDAELLMLNKKGNTLTSCEITRKNTVIAEKSKLMLEWYDIHSNPNVGIDKLNEIFIKRIQLTYKDLREDSLEKSTTIFAKEIKERVAQQLPELECKLKAKSFTAYKENSFLFFNKGLITKRREQMAELKDLKEEAESQSLMLRAL